MIAIKGWHDDADRRLKEESGPRNYAKRETKKGVPA